MEIFNKLPETIAVYDGTMADGLYRLTIQKKDGGWAVFYKGENFTKVYIKNGDLLLALTQMYDYLVKEGYIND
jgi:major membrane immunogen (membrane-anchored lipoprotein)